VRGIAPHPEIVMTQVTPATKKNKKTAGRFGVVRNPRSAR
jgi:hypothetical protein